MLDRETAWRIFASEFNRSDLIERGEEKQAPHYLITPTGARCNRVFVVGVITESENIGRENDLWRARVADPTGTFTIYAGQYQPEAGIFISKAEIPSFVAVIGKARTYERGDGEIQRSIRPEELNTVDEYTRDLWILDTARKTLERIDSMRIGIKAGIESEKLAEYLQSQKITRELSHGISRALKHYSEIEECLKRLEEEVYRAVRTILSEEEMTASRGEAIEEVIEPKEYVANVMEMLDTGNGVHYSDLTEAVSQAKITPETLETIIKELMSEGRCYEPTIGVLRIV